MRPGSVAVPASIPPATFKIYLEVKPFHPHGNMSHPGSPQRVDEAFNQNALGSRASVKDPQQNSSSDKAPTSQNEAAENQSATQNHVAGLDLEGFEDFPTALDVASEMDTDLWEACQKGDLETVKLLLKLGADANTERPYYNPEDDEISAFDCGCPYCLLRRPPSDGAPTSSSESHSMSEKNIQAATADSGEYSDRSGIDIDWDAPEVDIECAVMQVTTADVSGRENASDTDEASERGNKKPSTIASTSDISASNKFRGSWGEVDHHGLMDVTSVSALYVAIDRQHFEIAEFLLELEDLCLTRRYTKERRTSFFHALRKPGSTGLVERFLRRDDAALFIDIPDHFGRAPLHWAAAQGFVDVTRSLLQHGASVNVQDKQGKSPLITVIYLAPSRAVHVARTLLIHGADVNLQDHEGQTALHSAVSLSGLVGAKLLLAWGARVDITNGLGKTPLQCVPSHSKSLMALLAPENASKVKREMRDAWKPPQTTASTCHEFEMSTIFCLRSDDGRSEPQLWSKPVFDVIYDETPSKGTPGTTFYEQRQDQYLSILKGRGYNNITKKDSWKWIHVPSNNMTWIRDLLGTLCHSHRERNKVEENWHMMSFFDKHNVSSSGASCQRKPHMSAEFQGSSSSNPKWLSLVVPYVDFESRHYFHRGEASCETEQCSKMTRLHSEYPNFNGVSGIPHPQTLDQSYYDSLKDSDLADRDRDQVVYKWFNKMEFGEPKLLMVNQLWLWKIDESTIITAFPERWQDGPEHTLLQDVRHSDTPADVWKSPDAFIEYILSVCITIPREFDNVRFGFHILEVFESWIGNLVN
ncbi:hypothetical protein QBC43DRAFT_328654 [Cladorrhinum sp. PSN259]|nr:hypothetical protein QBC43DRAFT_328654 [Cladorrhinum sp. PSN259]